MRNATAARLPVPVPHSPAPGRSVSRKIPTTNAGSVLRRIFTSFAPHGSSRLKASTSDAVARNAGAGLTASAGTLK